MIVRFLAHIISVVFHPLLMVTYMLILLMNINPYIFGFSSISGNFKLVLLVFASTFIIPLFGVLIMKQIGLIQSFQMKDKLERVGPYILTAIFYLWMFINLFNNPTIPRAFSTFLLGSVIGLFITFFINIFLKISAHTVGVGGLVSMVVLTLFNFSYGTFGLSLGSWGIIHISVLTLLIFTILLAGIVGTSRLILKAHTSKEIILGYAVGIFSQIIAFRLLF